MLVAPDLAHHALRLFIDSKRFLFFKHLKAQVELSNGVVLGRHSA